MQVYADNAATTKMSQTSIDAMLPYMTTVYGNPSSLHSVGQRAKEALDAARETVAQCLGCEPREIIFTSGGSEADNQAIISAARLGEKKGKKHIISTAFEHHAVLHTLKKLEKEGFEIELLDVHQGHNITAQQVKDAIRPDTCLVTTMYANNEIGSILPIAEIGAICKKYGLLLIEDAAQGTGASYKGKKCGSFGDIAPVSVTEVHTNDSTADTQKTSIFEKALRPESLKTAKAQPISQMKAANKQTAGTLNSVSQPQSTGSTSAQRSTVALDLTAIAPTASSIMEISYNTKELTLSSVTGAATLTSWYESVPGTIVFACAERSEAAVGELLGQLRFELAAGSSSSKVTIKTKQLNETSFAAGQEKIRTVVLGDSLSQILPAIISSGEKDCPSRSFRDLDTTKWYHEAIDTMLREGLMNGTGNGLFEPNGTLTRAMLVTILWRSEGKPAASAQTSFTDVPAGAYYAEGVRWAAANGVVKGVSSTEFGPSKNITRQELVTILWRLAAKKGLILKPN